MLLRVLSPHLTRAILRRAAFYWPAVAAGLLAGLTVGAVVHAIGVPKRWQWWTASPNDLGAVLAAILPMLCAAYLLWGRTAVGSRRWWMCAPGIFITLGCTAGLVGTCSRGGFLAAITALAVLALRRGPDRRIVLAFLVMVVLAISIVPRACHRITADPTSDGSVTTRIALVHASAMMIADRPTGWGSGQFESVSESWYLDRYHGVPLWHPLNDALWIGAEWGVLAMAAFLIISLALITSLLGRFRQGDIVAGGAGAGLLGIATAGNFAGLLRPGGVAGLYLAITILACFAVWRSNGRERIGWHWPLVGVVLGLILTGIWWIWGTVALRQLPYRPLPATEAPMAIPRHGPTGATVVVLRAPGDSDNAICRHMLRPLAAAGFAASCMDDTRYATSELKQRPHILVVARGAITPPVLSPALRAIIAIDPTENSYEIAHINVPVLMIHGTEHVAITTAGSSPQGQGNIKNLIVPVPYCWPRHFMRFSDNITHWMYDLEASPSNNP